MWSRPAAGDFENRAANAISSGAPPTSCALLVILITATHFARLLHGLLTHRNTLRSQFLLRLGIHCLSHPSTSTACHAQHPDSLPRAASSTNRKFAIPDYFAEEKLAVQGRLSGRIAGGMQKGMKAHLDGVSHGCYTVKGYFPNFAFKSDATARSAHRSTHRSVHDTMLRGEKLCYEKMCR